MITNEMSSSKFFDFTPFDTLEIVTYRYGVLTTLNYNWHGNQNVNATPDEIDLVHLMTNPK